jgi:hypothetical protein
MMFTRKVDGRSVALVVGVGLLVAGLVGCTSGAAAPATTGSASTVPEPVATFQATGSAGDNIAFVRALVLRATKKGGLNTSSVAIARQLAADGFDRTGIQYTTNSTAAGLKPDSVVVAAQFKGECIIAQYGAGIGGVQIALAPVLKSGGCLLGRSIEHL